MIENERRTKNRTKIKLVIDLMIFIIFLIAMEPHASGIPIHEWLTTVALTAEGMQTSFPDRDRPDFDGAGPRGGGWMFGMVKNIGVIAILVTLVVVPKSLMRKKAVPVQAR